VKNEFINILKTFLMCVGPLGFRYTLGFLYYTHVSYSYIKTSHVQFILEKYNKQYNHHISNQHKSIEQI